MIISPNSGVMIEPESPRTSLGTIMKSLNGFNSPLLTLRGNFLIQHLSLFIVILSLINYTWTDIYVHLRIIYY